MQGQIPDIAFVNVYILLKLMENSWTSRDRFLSEASQIDFVHEKRHMDVLLETPPP